MEFIHILISKGSDGRIVLFNRCPPRRSDRKEVEEEVEALGDGKEGSGRETFGIFKTLRKS